MIHENSIDPSAPLQDVAGKVAFVTGGDSGIGLGIARALADAKMKVAITYRSDQHLAQALRQLDDVGDRIHAIKIDITEREAMVAAAAETVRVFGKVHLLVNNAGVAPMIPLSSATFDDWDWCINVNVNGVFNGIRAFLPHLRAHQEGGHIVATASMLGGVVVGPFWGVYSASKFAVVGMMEALRSELRDTNIGVSVLCPAGVTSNLGKSNRNRPEHLTRSGNVDPDAQALMVPFAESFAKIKEENGGIAPAMDPLEVGELVLSGIRHNYLYIITHSEFEEFIRERNEALLAAVPRGGATPSKGRIAMAQIAHTPIYADEIRRRAAELYERLGHSPC